jgi:sigma-B regulation protein RsbU (phosphoserine phosphatase)
VNKEHLLRKELSELHSEIDLNSLLNKIVVTIRHYLNCEESAIFLYDSLREELYFEIATGEKQEELKQIVLKKGEGVVGLVAEHEEPLIINDCASDPRFTAKTDLKTNFVTRSILGVPARCDNKLLGVLEAINKIDGKFDDEDKEMLQLISRFVSIPLQNAMLFKKIKQETREKDRLLELAKIISYSSNQDEVFSKLEEIICDIITPTEINVMVQTPEGEDKLYRLLTCAEKTYTAEKRDITAEMVDETTIGKNVAVFPLKARDRRLGILQLKIEKRVPEEVISLIRGLAAFVAILLENLEMQARMIEKEKIESELRIARDIQQSFLPNESIRINGLDVAYVNLPSSEVGGDYYDIVPFKDNETVFTINDISGHGVPASLLMSIFRTNFVYRIKKDKHMVNTISHLNNMIAETTEANLFVTSFTGWLDTEKMKIRYVNAGHNPPLIFRGDEIIELAEASLAVGIFPEVPYETAEVELKPGDLLVLYTDGIVEAENPAGHQYSLDRLIDFIKANREYEAEVIKERFIRELKGFIEKNSFEDDVTFILVKLNDE